MPLRTPYTGPSPRGLTSPQSPRSGRPEAQGTGWHSPGDLPWVRGRRAANVEPPRVPQPLRLSLLPGVYLSRSGTHRHGGPASLTPPPASSFRLAVDPPGSAAIKYGPATQPGRAKNYFREAPKIFEKEPKKHKNLFERFIGILLQKFVRKFSIHGFGFFFAYGTTSATPPPRSPPPHM